MNHLPPIHLLFLLLVLVGTVAGAGTCKRLNKSADPAGATDAAEAAADPPPAGASNRMPPAAAPAPPAAPLPPETCLLVGKVVQVLPVLEKDKKQPCGRVPCQALVRVEQIKGYGSAFPQPLAEKQEIKVYFPFTLSPTKDLFPELSQHLPGLTAGKRFEAQVRSAEATGGKQNFTINFYRVLPNK